MARPKTKILTEISLPPHFKGTLFSYLYKGQKVNVRGLGIFELVDIPDRQMFHNFSKETRTIKGYKRLKFTQSHQLKDALAKRHD